MRYIPHTDADVQQMLGTIGAKSISELFRMIPEKLRLERRLDLPAALSEQEALRKLHGLASKNANATSYDWFLGAGVYPHFIPSIIAPLVSRAEFLTAYTPYQPEFAQGTLQAIFEWQTMICDLTGLEVANASLYDGASASAEAVLMAMRLTQRSKIVITDGLHPHYAQVVRTYLKGLGAEISVADLGESGQAQGLEAQIDDQTACVVIQQPNFVGCLEDLEKIAKTAHAHGALLVVCVSEALSMALLTPPGQFGADIVCGEAQSFGVPMSFGGPHLGFLATQKSFLRQLPGRICGQTSDADGRRGFVLTLSTREQHIRREKATSNICTNQGLCLMMATIYLSLLGRTGLRKLAELNLAKAEYAKSRVRLIDRLDLVYSAPTFNEFAVRVADSSHAALERAQKAGCLGGLDLSVYGKKDWKNSVLVCTTELATREAIDRVLAALAGEMK